MAEKTAPKVLKCTYVEKKLRITKANIDMFQTMNERRRIRDAQVNRIYKTLSDGGHFESPIVVNELNGILRLIDGNHRIEAIKKYFETHADDAIDVKLIVYKGLSETEERGVYRTWSLGIKQTDDDYIQLHTPELVIYRLISENFPCKIDSYGGKESLKYKNVILPYILWKIGKGVDSKLPTASILEESKKLLYDDYKALYKFLEDFISVFGNPGKSNDYAKSTPFRTILRIYFENIDKLGRKGLLDRFSKKVLRNPILIRDFDYGGRIALKNLYKNMIEQMNAGYSKNLIEPPITFTF